MLGSSVHRREGKLSGKRQDKMVYQKLSQVPELFFIKFPVRETK